MSGKSARIVKKTAPPRSLEEINKEFSQLVYQAGQAQYQIHVIEGDLSRINFRLKEVNREAAARNELDKSTKTEDTNEQTQQ